MNKKSSLSLLLLVFLVLQLQSQKTLLRSGPMLGYSDMFEVKLWVQTKAAAKVQIAYWEKGTSSQPLLTEVVQTQKSQGFTAHLVADKVKPDKLYQYELRINNLPVKLDYPTYFQTQQLWNWRRDPPKFKLALGSCAYINEEAFDRPGKPYGGDYHIFKAMHEQRPDLMIWMGDNYYLREPDWNTKTGFIHRITHTRSLPELQPFLASTHHYAVWDDHDYGPNDSDRSFIHKDMATEVFKMFWGNPVYGLPGEGGITSYFSWGDCDFFLLDNRYFRKPNNRKTSECTILGEHQLEWLIDALTFSKAKFKFVVMGGQMLNSSANYETYINLCPEEQAYLLKCIEDESLKNVVFLTGDRHHSELSKIVNAKGNVIYDFTVSPLTAGVNINPEENLNRVEGTLVKERNFGIIEFEGPFNQRKLRFKIFNSNGVEIWSQEIMAQ